MTRVGTTLSGWETRPSLPMATTAGARAERRYDEQAYRIAKRGVDVVLSLLLLVPAAPLMVLTAVLIRCTSRGPVLFRQVRAGLHGRPFVMYKFRSMVDDAQKRRSAMHALNELQGPVFKMRNDPRLTRVGRLLRRTSIDELPQLFNVLRGDMSLVGPRPLPLDEVVTHSPAERRRLEVLPGLTCLWQISGRCEIPYAEWMQLDLLYIENRSLALDLQILVRTVPAVLSGRGAY